MKKIIIITLCCFFRKTAYSQTTHHVVASLFQCINKSPITSNIFIDRVFSSAGIPEFNQGIRIDTSSFVHFRQAWSDLNRASYVQNFATMEDVKDELYNKNYFRNTITSPMIKKTY